jgi:hypothetical protein
MMHKRLITLTAAAATACAIGVTGIAVSAAGHETSGASLSAKQQALAEVHQQYLQNQAAPRAVKAPHSVVIAQPTPCVATVALPFGGTGISYGGQGGPFGSPAVFAAISSWVGTVDARGRTYAVWSGATGTPDGSAGVPAVDVYLEMRTPDGCAVTYKAVGTFTSPTATGPLTITSVDGVAVHLVSPTGQSLYFDLTTDRFAAAHP